ncbi:MAG: hypothetical protein QX189_17535 [Methylococcales bacterium]
MIISEKQTNKAKEVVAYYTLSAAATGAFPIPAASAAIIAQNGLMLAHIASTLGVEITVEDIIKSLGVAGTANIAGRNFFIEGAKVLSWGTGSVWALAALSALGATTAGIQTYIIGCLTIEIAKNGCKPLSSSNAQTLIEQSKASYAPFIAEWSKKKIKEPAK